MLLTLKISWVYTDLLVRVLEVEEDSPRHLVLSGHLDALHALYITQRHRLKCGKNMHYFPTRQTKEQILFFFLQIQKYYIGSSYNNTTVYRYLFSKVIFIFSITTNILYVQRTKSVNAYQVWTLYCN